MNSFESIKKLREDIVKCVDKKTPGPILIGVSGGVACGKSRLVAQLIKELNDLPEKFHPVHIPFDYWINKKGLNSNTYVGRFFIDEFKNAVKCLANKSFWMCPRFDLVRNDINFDLKKIQHTTEVVEWEGRKFNKIFSAANIPDIPFGNGVFVELQTGRFFSLVNEDISNVYIIDGTLVFQNEELRSFYTIKVFVEGLWAFRVTRMIRRYNRKEVFGTSAMGEIPYVEFLVREAHDCADVEIEQQRTTDMLCIKSSVDSISNFLDLYQLYERFKLDNELGKFFELDIEQLDEAIKQTYEEFVSISEGHRSLLCSELNAIAESKHLIKLNNIQEILVSINKVISNLK